MYFPTGNVNEDFNKKMREWEDKKKRGFTTKGFFLQIVPGLKFGISAYVAKAVWIVWYWTVDASFKRTLVNPYCKNFTIGLATNNLLIEVFFKV